MKDPEPVPIRVAVLGAGSWGTALAALASPNADTLLWARDPVLARTIDGQHRNPAYLRDIDLPPELRCTSDFEAALRHAVPGPDEQGLIILGVPVSGLDEIASRLAQRLHAAPAGRLAIIWTCKGFEEHTGRLPHEIVESHIPDEWGIGLGVLSGPSFANEVVRGLPVALTAASAQDWVAGAAIQALHGRTARIYSSKDVIGVEVGGALKNIIAIACGISDGLELGANARAALITRGLAEIRRLGLALGGQTHTFSGLTGLGDLVLTATGDLSRNRQVGLAIGQGQPLEQIMASGMTAEGVRCARAARELGEAHGVELPITDVVCRVLFSGLSPEAAVSSLLAREARPEFTQEP